MVIIADAFSVKSGVKKCIKVKLRSCTAWFQRVYTRLGDFKSPGIAAQIAPSKIFPEMGKNRPN